MKKLDVLVVCFNLFQFAPKVLADVQTVDPSPCSSTPENATNSFNSWLSRWSEISDVAELQLASGEHCIRTFNLVHDLEDKSIVGDGSTVIRCAAGVGLALYNMKRFTLRNVVIDGCGLELDFINKFLEVVRAEVNVFLEISNTSHQYIAIVIGKCQNFVMENTSIINTEGLGLLAVNVVGHSLLSNIRFERNIPPGCFHPQQLLEHFSLEKIGGGALFIYHDYITPSGANASVEIRNSTFHRNSYCGYSFLHSLYAHVANEELNRSLAGGGGLSVVQTQLQYNVSMKVYNTVFTNNTSVYGGGAFIAMYAGVHGSEVMLQNCTFTSNGVDESLSTDPSYPLIGSALALFTNLVQPKFEVSKLTGFIENTVHLLDCDFENNTAFFGVVALFSIYTFVLPMNDRSELQFKFTRCVFRENKAVHGPALYAYELKASSIQPGILLTFEDVQVIDNKVLAPVSTTEASGVLQIERVNFTLAGKSLLQHNSGSALRAVSTNVFISGDALFSNNTAPYGGGLCLIESSLLVVTENTSVTFANNTAAVAGGAIFVESITSTAPTKRDCFLYFEDFFLCHLFGGTFCDDVSKMGVLIKFTGNKAAIGGMVYGSTLQGCPWGVELVKKYRTNISFTQKRLFMVLYDAENFTSPFHFDRAPDDSSSVSTPIMSLTARDPLNNSSISRLSLAPGIDRSIELATWDAFGQIVPGIVTSRSTATTTSVLGSNFVFIGNSESKVSSLSVSATDANSKDSSAEVSLYTLDTFSEVLVNVSFTSCPGGFYFNETYKKCTCLEDLERFRVTCTSNGELIVPVNTWVGVVEGEVQLVTCSYDFCNPLVSRIKVDASDMPFSGPCNSHYHRSGPGCGSCEANYSSAFGSNSCLRCSNSFILLLLLFAVLGIVLIAVMLLLRISIAGGFLNGILFFSNVASLYSSLYAPAAENSFLVFSWFSLKFGIQSCFFDGMRPLHIAALNFVFPLYLYLLVMGIVLLARMSTKFAEWLFMTGSSPPKIFATICIMTYSSLLESCVQAISATMVHVIGPNRTVSELRWDFDPSQRYFHGAHGALATFAILLLVFYLIPAPILYMVPPKTFNMKFVHKFKRFFDKFKPIYDAVWAPLKSHYFFWVSLRLYMRFPPLVFVSFIRVPENLLSLTFFLLFALFLHGVIQPFQGVVQNVYDSVLQLLLLTITVTSLYFSQLQQGDTGEDVAAHNREVSELYRRQRPAIATIMFVAHCICVLVFLSHLWMSFPQLKKWTAIVWSKIAGCRREKGQADKENQQAGSSTVSIQASSIEYEPSKFRESILDEPEVIGSSHN